MDFGTFHLFETIDSSETASTISSASPNASMNSATASRTTSG